MEKIILHNKTNLPLTKIMEYAIQIVDVAMRLLKHDGDMMSFIFDGNINKGEIIRRKTCYTIIIS